jgi:hypothetical protein
MIRRVPSQTIYSEMGMANFLAMAWLASSQSGMLVGAQQVGSGGIGICDGTWNS